MSSSGSTQAQLRSSPMDLEAHREVARAKSRRIGTFALTRGEHADVVKKTRTAQAVVANGSRPRRFAGLVAGLIVLAIAGSAYDLARDRKRALEAGDVALQSLARVSDALWLADEARIHALLARLRVELRTGATWTGTGDIENGATDPSAPRRRDTLLRRAIEGAPEVQSIDLVVAGPQGLVSVRVARELDPQATGEAAGEPEADAKSLWYSDVVQRAVEANGHRVARSAVALLPGDVEGRVLARTVIALHDVDEVVQGVLIATIDLEPLASRLASLSAEDLRFALVTQDGARVGQPPHAPRGEVASLLGEAMVANDAPEIVESEGLRSLLQPVTRSGDEPPDLAFWLERDAPPSILAAAAGSPWLAVLVSLALLEGALVAWSRDRSAGPGSVAAAPGSRLRSRSVLDDETSGMSRSQSLDPGQSQDDEIAVRQERFVLRDWLADVRGCLEREAATRGLTLDLRCERSLPREIQQDPLWLGGLVISLGREALDATSASRVALEVTAEGESSLRFQIDAGDTDLEPVVGMDVIAGRIGATLEQAGRGRLAVVVAASIA